MRIEPGRIAVVTGGASGIGFALAAAAASRGMHVLLADVRADALEAAAARLRETGASLTAVVADVSAVTDTVHLVRGFVPRLLETGEPAQLLVTGSMASVAARPGISPYVAAKHALLGLCESLSQELAAVDAAVGVTLLIPGKVATEMSSSEYPEAITPDEAARIAFDAVAADRPLAFTHAARIPEVEQRFAAIVAGGRLS